MQHPAQPPPANPMWEMIAAAMQTTAPRPAIGLAMPPAEKAWLTFQALDQSDDIILLLEHDGGAATSDAVVIGANGAFRRASGYSDAQIVGGKVTALFPTGSHAEVLMEAIRRRGTLRTELACSRAGGGTFMLGLHLMPAPAQETGSSCFVVLGRDITAVLEARQMQDSVQRLLAKVFTSVDEAVAIINGAGRIVMTNRGVDRLLGYKPNELVGRISLEVVAADARAPTAATIKQQMEQRRDVTYSAPFLRADGSQMIVGVTSVVVSTDDVKQFRILTLRAKEPEMTAARTESAGRINLIGLDEVRAALGDRWHAVADRAMTTAEAVLKRRCGPQDSYSRVDDTSFLVCFGALSEREAAFRAAMIGREIRERLIGQGNDADSAYVRSIAAAVRLPEQGGGSAAASQALLLDGLEKQLGRLEEESRQTLQAAWSGSACELDPVLGQNPGETVANQVRLPSELDRSVVSALSVLSRKESEAFDLDALLLALAAQQAITAMGRGASMPLLVNVRFDVFLTRAATERYLAVCRKIDPRVSGRLIMMLSSLPQGLPKTRLLECVTRLRPFCCGVGYYVDDLSALALIDLSNSFNPVVALPLAALSAMAADKPKVAVASLHARRAKVLVYRVASDKDAAALRSLGADMISMEQPQS